MSHLSLLRRRVLAVLSLCAIGVGTAMAADPLAIGVLIPGSKTDKGWMESGYDGVVAAQKEFGAKLKVQIIENINYADMEQALTEPRDEEQAGDRRRRPDAGRGDEGREALSRT